MSSEEIDTCLFINIDTVNSVMCKVSRIYHLFLLDIIKSKITSSYFCNNHNKGKSINSIPDLSNSVKFSLMIESKNSTGITVPYPKLS